MGVLEVGEVELKSMVSPVGLPIGGLLSILHLDHTGITCEIVCLFPEFDSNVNLSESLLAIVNVFDV